MTICVAALYRNRQCVLAAADRMITAGNIQFEPSQPKVIPATSSIVYLLAGDSPTQTMLCNRVQMIVNDAIHQHPDQWVNVRDVAETFARFYHALRHEQATAALLSPFGLNGQSFIDNQQSMSPQLVQMLATEMLNFQMPPVETLIVGVDTLGAHIYLVENGRVSCHDGVGFAAIGSGTAHAESQFMFSRFNPSANFTRTLTLTYTAKKRAEIAPGVGGDTDMFLIGPEPGTYMPIAEHHLDRLENIYEQLRNQEQQAVQTAEESVQSYVEEITNAATARNQADTQDGDGNTSANEDDTPATDA